MRERRRATETQPSCSTCFTRMCPLTRTPLRYLLAYVVGDIALYLLQKIARGDLHYFIPIDGGLGLFVSVFLRVTVKVITDYTGCLNFR